MSRVVIPGAGDRAGALVDGGDRAHRAPPCALATARLPPLAAAQAVKSAWVTTLTCVHRYVRYRPHSSMHRAVSWPSLLGVTIGRLHDDLARHGVTIVTAPFDGPFGRTFAEPGGYTISLHG